jgi:hypothetical protein
MTDRELEPDESLDLQAIAADDELLDRLGHGAPSDALTWDGAVEQPPGEATSALTWDGTVEQPPAEISDAIIWTDEPVRPPTGTPVKKQASEASDDAERLLTALLADLDDDLSASVDRLRALPDLVPAADLGPASTSDGGSGRAWGRVARRTGTRGLAAAAAVVVSLGGVAAASVVAGPGNPLYEVHKLFAGPDAAKEQSYAAGRVSAALDDAQRALDAHKVGLAHGKVTAATSLLKGVAAGPAKDALVARRDALAALVAAQLAATDSPNQTSPGTPTLTPSPTGSTSGPGPSTTSPGGTQPDLPGRSATPTNPRNGHGKTDDKGAHPTPDDKGNGKGGTAGQDDGRSGGKTSDGHVKSGDNTTGTADDTGHSGSVEASPSATASPSVTASSVATGSPKHGVPSRHHRATTTPTRAATTESGASGSGTSIKLPSSGSTGSLD